MIRLLHVTLPVMQDVERLLAGPTVASPLLQVLHIEHLSQNTTADSERRPLMPLLTARCLLYIPLSFAASPLPLTPPRALRHFNLSGCDIDPLPHTHSLFDMLQAYKYSSGGAHDPRPTFRTDVLDRTPHPLSRPPEPDFSPPGARARERHGEGTRDLRPASAGAHLVGHQTRRGRGLR